MQNMLQPMIVFLHNETYNLYVTVSADILHTGFRMTINFEPHYYSHLIPLYKGEYLN